MNATAQILAVVTAAEGIAATVEGALADVAGESGLLVAEQIQGDLAGALEAVTSGLQTAKAIADARVNALRIESKDAILARVAGLIAGGALTLADLTARLGIVAPVVAAPAPAPVAAEAVAAPAPVDAAPAPTPATEPAAVVADAAAIVPAQALTAPYKNPVKFFDPATGNGWSGRGPMPSWFAALLVGGKTKEDFRVAGTPAKVAAPAPAAVAAVAPVAAVASVEAAPVDTPAPAVDAAAVHAPAVDALSTTDGDIGETVSFDASALEDDVAPEIRSADDIGEFLDDFATRTPGNVISFSANLLAA